MDKGFKEFGAALNATGQNMLLQQLSVYNKGLSGHPMVYQCEWPLYQSHHGINPNYTAIRSSYRQ